MPNKICEIDAYGCPFHACMGEGCQAEHVKEQASGTFKDWEKSKHCKKHEYSKKGLSVLLSDDMVYGPKGNFTEPVDITNESFTVCKVCGCTNNSPCDGGCWWVGPDLCSACADKFDFEEE